MMKDANAIAHFIVLREQGKTYQEIGDMHGVSKQCVERSIKNFERLFNTRVRKNNYDIEKIVYQGIYQLFKSDNTMTVTKLTKMIYGYSSGNELNHIDSLIKGKNTKVTIKDIEKLIEITGNSFEELFKIRESKNKHEVKGECNENNFS